MKKLMYLLVVGVMFAFTACGGGETTETACADDCAKECCVKADVCANTGEACLEDHSCCAADAAGDDAAGDDAAGDDAAGDDAAGDDAAGA